MDNVYGSREWATSNVNFITGCSNDCLYCYSKALAINYGRKTSENWHVEEVREKDLIKNRKKIDGRIMFPSSHDITLQNLNNSIELLKKLLKVGNQVLIVSKPHFECIKEICLESENYKSNILFRFSIGSADNNILKLWEPGAPSFEERLECLKYSYEHGFATSVSCEPMLDNNIGAVIDAALPFITDSLWLGKINNLSRNLILNDIDDVNVLKQADKLLAWQCEEEIKALYDKYKDVEKIKWKSSIKTIMGIPLSAKVGADI